MKRDYRLLEMMANAGRDRVTVVGKRPRPKHIKCTKCDLDAGKDHCPRCRLFINIDRGPV